MKKFFIILIIFWCWPFALEAANLSERVSGRILLQTESEGEAWYVNPIDQKRYFLGRPKDAFDIMKDLGVGISNQNLEKIPVSVTYSSGADIDQDGLSDALEEALGTDKYAVDTDDDSFSDYEEIEKGYNPLQEGKLNINENFVSRQAGRIFLQVESKGEAWYVNPADNKRYFLGRPQDAFNIMKALGLGISNQDIERIKAGTASYNASELEIKMFAAVNRERLQADKKNLIWNDELAKVARKHSLNLAMQSQAFTGEGMTCEFPFIHHEGIVFGNYNTDRLKNEGIYYYSMAGENIALVPNVETIVLVEEGSATKNLFDTCPDRRKEMDMAFKEALDNADNINDKLDLVKKEISQREEVYLQEKNLEITEQNWFSEEEVVRETVDGWMNSSGHRANILETDFNESGIGIAIVGGYVISTQVFIKKVDCGYKDGKCCEEDGYYPYCFTGFSCENNICL